MFDEIITMYFQTLNRPSSFLGKVNRSQSRIRNSQTVGVQPSSVFLNTNQSGDVPVSKTSSGSGSSLTNNKRNSPLLSEVNTVGVVGGVSALCTLHFLEKLIRWTSKEEEETLPFVVCSDPVLSNELLFYERSSSPSLNTKQQCAKFDPTPILKNLKTKKAFLEQAGARCIVMPCHISHAWYREISKECSVPFLHIGVCVAKELIEANLKPLEAGSRLRIGVLATDATLKAGFYQEILESEGFEVVLPDKATMEHTTIPAFEALTRKDMEGARNLLRIAVQVLLVRGVNTVILAFDEMSGLLPGDDPLLKKCINPMDALARSTAKWARTTEREHKNT